MNTRGPAVALTLVGLALAVAVGLPAAGAASDFTITTPDRVDIPERTVSIDGTDYQVSAVGRVAQGDTLEVDVTDPNDRQYDVYLYNRNTEIEQTDAMDGSGTATFSTSSLEPGTYLAGVYYDGQLRVVEPVVVEGYTVTIDPPASVEQGATATVDLTVTATAGGTIDRVQVVVGDAANEVRVNATGSGSSYTAEVPTDAFAAGTYNIYGVVRGTEETDDGRAIILGLSDGDQLEVTEPTATPTPTPTDSAGGGGGTGGGGDGGADPSPEFRVNGTLSAERVTVGESVTVDYTVQNVGPVRGDYEATLTLDGAVVTESRTFELAPQGATQSSFQYTFTEPGVYTVAITDTQVGVVRVRPASATAVYEATSDGRNASFAAGPVERVTFERNAYVDVTVTQLEGLAAGVGQPPGTLLVPLNISVPADTRDVGATVRLNLSQATLANASVDAAQLRLARYDDDAWTILETSVVRETGAYAILEARTEGFPTFAIVAVETSPTATASPSVTASPSATNGDVIDPASPTASGPTSPTATGQPGFGVVAAVVALLGVGMWRRLTGRAR